jgi:CheY-like chemotaxis protein
MKRILVIEDAEPQMRLMVWLLTDHGSDVKVTTSLGAVITDIETFKPDTVVFNSRFLGETKDVCIDLIRRLQPDVRVIDVSSPPLAGVKRFIEISDHNEGDARRSGADDSAFSGDGLIHMINHRSRRASA